MTFLKSSHEGYLMIDHRASPGISETFARRLGLDPKLVGEGKLGEWATYGCPHCATNVLKNPLRTRERAHCNQCDKYICDVCDAERCKPDYVHRTFQQVVDMVQSERFVIAGGTASAPILKPKTGD